MLDLRNSRDHRSVNPRLNSRQRLQDLLRPRVQDPHASVKHVKPELKELPEQDSDSDIEKLR